MNYTYFFVEYQLILFKIGYNQIVYGRLMLSFDVNFFLFKIGMEFKNGFILCFISKQNFSNFFDPFIYNMKNEIIYGITDFITRTEMKKYQIICAITKQILKYNLKNLALFKQILL